ncbi:GNAT family N-acetyltransferase [Deinococcus ficus]|uniref:N-acetyltransferase n=1 Tax=Deinococcus ficus TaxID=317577 RepID=A0A221SXT0_9DEIO|nr:GNAT family N-acetyltransferase [Deinococcus ficus]ASN81454.1 N-acetyltransferase [Deinococcus ficus]
MPELSPTVIRAAQIFDAPFAAPLIQETIGAIGRALTGTTSDGDAAHVIAEFFPLRGHRLSFTNTLIAERGGRPVGLLVAYPGELAVMLDQPFREHRRSLGLPPTVDSEGLPGELYLDTLAVTAGARGQGVGSALLEAAPDLARRAGVRRLGLLVEDGNPAVGLYARHGFTPAGERVVAGGRFMHLTRDLE